MQETGGVRWLADATPSAGPSPLDHMPARALPVARWRLGGGEDTAKSVESSVSSDVEGATAQPAPKKRGRKPKLGSTDAIISEPPSVRTSQAKVAQAAAALSAAGEVRPPPLIGLRNYQMEAITAVLENDKRGIHRQLVSMPTGKQ